MSSLSDITRGADGHFLAARFADLVCYYYVNQESEANFRHFRDWTAQLEVECPRGTGSLIWVDAIAARHPPSALVRQRYADLSAQNEKRQFAQVSIIQAEGFAGATVRAVLTSLTLIRRVSFPQYVTQDALDGVRWLLGKMPPDPLRPSVKEVRHFFQQTLSEYRQSHPQ